LNPPKERALPTTLLIATAVKPTVRTDVLIVTTNGLTEGLIAAVAAAVLSGTVTVTVVVTVIFKITEVNPYLAHVPVPILQDTL
jgi:hypothetical protein